MSASLCALCISACANHPCHTYRDPERANASSQPKKPQQAPTQTEAPVSNQPFGSSTSAPTSSTSSTVSPSATVLVFKPDGSLQCQTKKGLTPEEMEKQLSGIKVISRDKRPDGLMHIQVCGSPTGMINVYEIPVESLKEAEARGFKKLDRN